MEYEAYGNEVTISEIMQGYWIPYPSMTQGLKTFVKGNRGGMEAICITIYDKNGVVIPMFYQKDIQN